MNDFKEKLKERTQAVAVNILKTCENLPETNAITLVKKQLIRCATSD